ncbi:glycosyltransferase family 2 protein [Natronomonas salina]|uniref:glycosyltransferase family 2 protein n=1 Tax=Natronomonas salina TaxID=1710540 RepID=UPI0015B6C120|nr:glycosyltransferase family 2 protein [Natronomonas salina]QLD88762.1 glycosyltransferase family 2 protein [Natronomonas salina]
MSGSSGEQTDDSKAGEENRSAVINGSDISLPVKIDTPTEGYNKPAVGVVATSKNVDEVARVVMRAKSADYPVLITTPEGGESGLFELTNIEGVHYIPVDMETDATSSELSACHRLAAAARALAFSGLIFVENTGQRVDFERSSVADEGYIKRAIPTDLDADVGTLVAIPAYNEENTIASVVEDAQGMADSVIVVDDGSSDETAARAREAGATVVAHERNRGYGAALQTAFETAELHDVGCLVIIDGDGQHDTSDIPVLAEKVTEGEANVAIGSRFAGENRSAIPAYRRFGIGAINVMSNLSMGTLNPADWVSDTQSGFRAYDPHAIETLADANLGDDMDASLDILYHIHKEDFHIEEMPTIVNYDVENGHSQNPVTHGVRLISTILRTVEKDHPIKFLGVPAVIMVLVGSGFGYWTMANYLTSQTFPLGLALVSVFLILLGVFSGFTAIMLHSLSTHMDGTHE